MLIHHYHHKKIVYINYPVKEFYNLTQYQNNTFFVFFSPLLRKKMVTLGKREKHL